MRTGIATIPLDYGRCPRWLFERMKKLSRSITLAIVEEFGPEEFLKKFSDPVWFQSLGCVIGFDWNSSGLTTITLGALKSGIFDIQDQLGVYVCGGKRTSRETPKEIETYGISRGFSFAPDLIYASKITAKIDSSLIQDNYQLYQHNFLFDKAGHWAVIQQGMNTENKTARRYHWLSFGIKDFTQEPHSGIMSDTKLRPLNLVAKESKENKEIAVGQVVEEPKTFLKNIKFLSEKSDILLKQKRGTGFAQLELNDVEFYDHPVTREKFDLKRLGKTIFAAYEKNPKNFENLLSLKGVGPRTIRALSLVAELIYGAKPSYEDPARYSFALGGKDGTPYPVDRQTYDRILEVMKKGIKNSKTSIREKTEAQKRLIKNFQK